VKPPHPVSQQLELGARLTERPFAGNDLEDEHPESIDVGFARGLVADRVLWRDEAPCSGDREVGEGVLVDVVHQAGEAEIAEAAVEAGVEHDVARLDVAVEHHALVLVVNVVESGGDIRHYVVPCLPPESWTTVFLPVPEKMLVQATV